MHFSGPLPPGSYDARYLWISVGHLTGWPVAQITTRDTSNIFLSFIKEKILFAFGPPKYIISTSARCSTAGSVQSFMNYQYIIGKTILQYAPMRNGNTEPMVGGLKQAVKETILKSGQLWPDLVAQGVYGYRRWAVGNHLSPFLLIYGIQLRLCSSDANLLLNLPFQEFSRVVETLAVQSHRLQHGTEEKKNSSRLEYNIGLFNVGKWVWVAKGKAIGALKIRSFESKWYQQCLIVVVKHLRYVLLTDNGNTSRESIHARRLLPGFRWHEHLLT